MRGSITGYIIFFALFFLVVYFTFEYAESNSRNNLDNFYKSELKGVLVNKYIDSTEHNYTYLILDLGYVNSSNYKLHLNTIGARHLYPLINIGDDFIKESNSFIVEIEKKNGQKTTHKIR